MKKFHNLLITTTVIASILGWNIHSTPVAAQLKTYKCESYKTIDGQRKYRVTPAIAGSFTGPYLMGGKVSSEACFVPLTKKQCFFKNNEPDPIGLTTHEWYNCGQEWLRPGFWIKTDFGKGEIVENNNGKKYHVFSTLVKFTFQ
ncbi:MAG: hypothetical protein PT118_05645 [Aphanizomenon gracile PMC644.10]|nr:hypothetical protein [Aphanizomenon gracile PMC644.10]